MKRPFRAPELDFRRPRELNNLGLRIASAIVLGGLVLAVTWLGGLAFHLMIAFFSGALLYEWLQMAGARIETRSARIYWLLLVIALIPIVMGLHAYVILSVAALALLASVGVGIWQGSQVGLGGMLYGVLAAVSIDQLRSGGNAGLDAIVYLFAVVWATDSFAYIFGRLIGGRKLAPSISPGKTWSGALGGALAAVIIGAGAGRIMGVHGGFVLALAALLLSVVSQIGDLLESGIKRRFGVKDSGNLIPGHGGVMDRVDGLVAAGLALYVIALVFGGFHEPSQGLFGAR